MGASDLPNLVDWVPDETLRNHILVDHPQRLFGFPACWTSGCNTLQ